MSTHGSISWYLKKLNIKARPNRFYEGMEQAWDRSGEKSSSWKGGKRSIHCDHCGKKMARFPSLIGEKNFCDLECKGNYQSADVLGKKYGLLTVTKFIGKDNHSHKLWLCSCECGGEKEVKTSDLLGGYVASCGCRKHIKGRHNSKWVDRIEVRCANPKCNKPKLVYPARKALYGLLFCNTKCHGEYARITEERKGTNSPRYKERLNVACAYCGKGMSVTQWRKAAYKNNFCKGTDCQAKWKSENQLGSQNGNWRGGLSFEPYPVTWNFRLREMIRERDGRTCQVCGTKENGTRLSVHHIDYDKANIAQQNLVALCHGCHVNTNSRREEWIKFFLGDAVSMQTRA